MMNPARQRCHHLTARRHMRWRVFILEGVVTEVKKPKVNPFDTAYEQYRLLSERSQSVDDISEKNLYFRRRINLLGVMQFLLSE